jgi:hypothetical protein
MKTPYPVTPEPPTHPGSLLILVVGIFLLGLTECNQKPVRTRAPVLHEAPPIFITF